MRDTSPNIILFNCDDLGFGDLGCYGSALNHTPNIDRLAQNGVKCTDWYAPSPVCSPSRGALMTGCYPPRIGFAQFDGKGVLFPGQGCGLSQKETTLAGTLKKSGYRTMIVGKWHCGDQPEFLPQAHGFDSYYGLPYSNDMGRQAGRDRQFCPLPLLLDEQVIEQQPDLSSLTARYTEAAVRFIRQSGNGPFFLYFAHMYVHLPHYAPEAFVKKSRNGDFGACMECLDWSVGVLMHELETLGLTKNTLIVFTSDNGSRNDHGASNGPLRGQKGTTWEGGQRVPCIFSWESVLSKGAVCSQVMSHIDFLPTFTRMAGARLDNPQNIDGQDVSAVLFDGAERGECENEFFYYRMEDLEAVRVGPWKLHFSKRGEAMQALFHLGRDIAEEHDVYAEEPQIVQALSQRARYARQRWGDKRTGVAGDACRPIGRVENPRCLTEYDEGHPYFMAEYDKSDAG